MLQEVERYRKVLKEFNSPKAEWSDNALILDIHRQIRDNNEDLDDYSPEFAKKVRELETRPDKSVDSLGGMVFGEAKRGLASDFKQNVAAVKGAAGLITGDDSYLEGAEETMREGTIFGIGEKEPTVQDFDMVHDWESGTRFLSGAVGQAGSDIATVIMSLGLGTVVKKSVEKKVKKEVYDKLQEKALQKGASQEAAKTFAQDRMAKDVYKNVIESAGNRGAVWAAGLTATAESGTINTGEVYQNLYEYTKLDPSDPSYLSPADARWLSLQTGVAMGAIDSAVPAYLMKGLTSKLGKDKAVDAVKNFMANMPAKNFLLAPVAEGSTEVLQEFIQMSVEKSVNGKPWGPQDYNALKNAGLLGTIGGGTIGTGGYLVQRGLKKLGADPVEELGGINESDINLVDRELEKISANFEVGDYVIRPNTGEYGRVVKNLGNGKIVIVDSDGEVIKNANGGDEVNGGLWSQDGSINMGLTDEELIQTPTGVLDRIASFSSSPEYKAKIQDLIKRRKVIEGELDAEEIPNAGSDVDESPEYKVNEGVVTSKSAGSNIKHADFIVKEDKGNLEVEITLSDDLDEEAKIAVTNRIEDKIRERAKKEKKSFQGKFTWVDDLSADEQVSLYFKSEDNRELQKDILSRLSDSHLVTLPTERGTQLKVILKPSKKFDTVEEQVEQFKHVQSMLDYRKRMLSSVIQDELGKLSIENQKLLQIHYPKKLTLQSERKVSVNETPTDRAFKTKEAEEQLRIEKEENLEALKGVSRYQVYKIGQLQYYVTSVDKKSGQVTLKSFDGNKQWVGGASTLGTAIENPKYKGKSVYSTDKFIAVDDYGRNIRQYIDGKNGYITIAKDEDGSVMEVGGTQRDVRPTTKEIKDDISRIDPKYWDKQSLAEKKALDEKQKKLGLVKNGEVYDLVKAHPASPDHEVVTSHLLVNGEFYPQTPKIRIKSGLIAGETSDLMIEYDPKLAESLPLSQGFKIVGIKGKPFDGTKKTEITGQEPVQGIPLVKKWKTQLREWTQKPASSSSSVDPRRKVRPLTENFQTPVEFVPADDRADPFEEGEVEGKNLGTIVLRGQDGRIYVRDVRAEKRKSGKEYLVSHARRQQKDDIDFDSPSAKSEVPLSDITDEGYEVVGTIKRRFNNKSTKATGKRYTNRGLKSASNFASLEVFEQAVDSSVVNNTTPMGRFQSGLRGDSLSNPDDEEQFDPDLELYAETDGEKKALDQISKNLDLKRKVKYSDIANASVDTEAEDSETVGELDPVRGFIKSTLGPEFSRSAITVLDRMQKDAPQIFSASSSDEDSSPDLGNGTKITLRKLISDAVEGTEQEFLLDVAFTGNPEKGSPPIFTGDADLFILAEDGTTKTLMGEIKNNKGEEQTATAFFDLFRKITDIDLASYAQNKQKVIDQYLNYISGSQKQETASTEVSAMDDDLNTTRSAEEEVVIQGNNISDEALRAEAKRQKKLETVSVYDMFQKIPSLFQAMADANDKVLSYFMQTASMNQEISVSSIIDRALNMAIERGDKRLTDALRLMSGHPHLKGMKITFWDNDNWKLRQPRAKKKASGVVTTHWGHYNIKTRSIHMGPIYSKPILGSDGRYTFDNPMDRILNVLTEEFGHAILYDAVEAAGRASKGKGIPKGYKGGMSKSELIELGKKSSDLLKFLREKQGNSFRAGLQNEQELWDHLFFDQEFRDWVASLDRPKWVKGRLLDWVYRVMAKIMGNGTLLGDADTLLQKFLDESQRNNTIDSNTAKGFLTSEEEFFYEDEAMHPKYQEQKDIFMGQKIELEEKLRQIARDNEIYIREVGLTELNNDKIFSQMVSVKATAKLKTGPRAYEEALEQHENFNVFDTFPELASEIMSLRDKVDDLNMKLDDLESFIDEIPQYGTILDANTTKLLQRTMEPSLAEVLQSLSNEAISQQTQDFATFLLEAIKDDQELNVRVSYRGDNPLSHRGEYSAFLDEIRVYDTTGMRFPDEETLLHEIIHATTVRKFAFARKTGGELKETTDRLREAYMIAKEDPAIKKLMAYDMQFAYGMSNMDEFMAHAMTNKQMQEKLRGIPSPSGSETNSLLDYILGIIRDILLGKDAKGTLLEDVVKNVTKVVESKREFTNDQYLQDFSNGNEAPDGKVRALPRFDKGEIAEGTTFEKGSSPSKLIGYRAMRHKDGQAISGADSRQSLKLGKNVPIQYGGGFFLTNSAKYAEDYYAIHDENALLKIEFDKSDLLSGNLEDREPEVQVRKGTVLDYTVFTEDDVLTAEEEIPTLGRIDRALDNPPEPVETSPFEGGKVRSIASLFRLKKKDQIPYDKLANDKIGAHASRKIDRAGDRILGALDRAIYEFPNFASWYQSRLEMALDIFQSLDEDVTQEEDKAALLVTLAITSNGADVKSQTFRGWDIYNHWKSTGRLSGAESKGGSRDEAVEIGLALADALADKLGSYEDLGKFIFKKGTVSDLKKELRGFGFTQEETNKMTKGELIDEEVPFSLIFGPKLGSFYNNLNGDFDSITMDRWFMRTFGRAMGTQLRRVDITKESKRLTEAIDAIYSNPEAKQGRALLRNAKVKKSLKDPKKQAAILGKYFTKAENRTGLDQFSNELRKASNRLFISGDGLKLIEAPTTGSERRWIRKVMLNAIEKFNKKYPDKQLVPAEAQALLWYYEKVVHETYGSRQKDSNPDYANAANELYKRERGGRSSDLYEASDGVEPRGGSSRSESFGGNNQLPDETEVLTAEEEVVDPIEQDSVLTGTLNSLLTALNEVERVNNVVLGKLDDETLEAEHISSYIQDHRKLPEDVQVTPRDKQNRKGQTKKVSVMPEALKKVLTSQMSFIEARGQIGLQDVETDSEMMLQDIGNDNLRNLAIQYALQLLSGYDQKARNELSIDTEQEAKLSAEVSKLAEKLSKLSNPETAYDQGRAMEKLTEELKRVMKEEGIALLAHNIDGVQPDIPSASQINNLFEGQGSLRLFDLIAEIAEKTDIENQSFAKAYETLKGLFPDIGKSDAARQAGVDSYEGFLGRNAPSQDFLLASLAQMLGNDGRNSVTNAHFSLALRVAKNALLSSQRAEWGKVRKAIAGEPVEATGPFEKIIKKLIEAKSQHSEKKRDLNILRDRIRLQKIQTEEYGVAINDLADQLGRYQPIELYEGSEYKRLELVQFGESYEIIEVNDVFTRAEPNSPEGRRQMQNASAMLKILKSPAFKEKYENNALAHKYFLTIVDQITRGSTPIMLQTTFVGQRIAMLQSFQKIFSDAGVHGNALAKALNGLTTDLRQNFDRFITQGTRTANRMNKLRSKLDKKRFWAKTSYHTFVENFHNKVMGWIESHPEYTDYEQAAKVIWKEFRENGYMDYNYDYEILRNYFIPYLREVDESRKMIKGYAQEIGLSVEDENIAIRDFITGDLQSLFRKEIDKGAMTVPRMPNISKIAQVVGLFTNNPKGEQDEQKLKGLSTYFKIKRPSKEEVDQMIEDGTMVKVQDSPFDGDEDNVSWWIEAQLSISQEQADGFLDPFFTDLGAFNIPFTKTTDNESYQIIKPEKLRMLWQNTTGSPAQRMRGLMEKIADTEDMEEFDVFAKHFLDQVQKRLNTLNKLRTVSDESDVRRAMNPYMVTYGKNIDASLNGRDLTQIMPSTFFEYATFGEMDMTRFLGKLVHSKHFGRNEDVLEEEKLNLIKEAQQLRNNYNNILKSSGIDKVLGDDEFPNIIVNGKYLPFTKKKITSAGYNWDDFRKLERKLAALQTAKKALVVFDKYLSDSEGYMKDDKLAMDILSYISFGTTNSITSTITSLGAITEIRRKLGLNVESAKAFGRAAFRVPHEITGGLIERLFSYTILQSEYDKYLIPQYQQLQKSLEEGRYAQTGMDGDLADPMLPILNKKIYRRIKTFLQSTGGKRNRNRIEGGNKFIPVSFRTFVGAPFAYGNQVINRAIGHAFVRYLHHRVSQAVKVLDEMGVDNTNLTVELTTDQLGIKDTWADDWIFGEKRKLEEFNQRLASEGMSITKLAQDYRRRREQNKDELILTNESVLVANQIGISDVSNDTLAGKPVLTSQGGGMYLAPLLNWSLSAFSNGMNDLRGTDGRFLSTEGLKHMNQFLLAASAITIPSAMWILSGLEWWDEEVRGKTSKTPQLPPQAKIPVVGVPLAIADPRWSWMAFVESTARVNNMFGIGQEMVSYAVSDQNPWGQIRELDERILAVNVVKGIINATKSAIILASEGEAPSYADVVRPFMFATGLNGLVQQAQIVSNLMPSLADLPILSSERSMTDLISMKDKLRAHALLLGMEPRVKFSGGYKITAQSVAIKDMEKAAYGGDSKAFLDAYRRAVKHSKSMKPVDDVISKFKQRNLRKNLTRYTLSDADYNILLSTLDSDMRRKVIRADAMHESYLRSIGGRPSEVKTDTIQTVNELRMLLAE